MSNMCISLFSVVLIGLCLTSKFTEASPVDDDMPDSCAGLPYCFEKGNNYPERKIEKLLEKIQELKVENYEPTPSIGSRYGDTYDEPDCPSNFTESPIYYIRDTNDKVRVVVQSPKFQQIYSVQSCLNEGRITKDTPHFLRKTTLEKFRIECVNQRMNFDFLVLSDGQDLKMEAARVKGGIPVCCRCRYSVDN